MTNCRTYCILLLVFGKKQHEQNKTKQNKIKYARVAQLVELLLAKEEVAGSSPVSRSRKTKKEISNRISSFFVFSSPVRTRRFSVYVPLRSAQSQHPQDAVRRLALSENKKEISSRISQSVDKVRGESLGLFSFHN